MYQMSCNSAFKDKLKHKSDKPMKYNRKISQSER